MKINNTAIHIIKGDITELSSEAIVNPANCELTMKRGLAETIKAKGGIVIEEEAFIKGPLNPGDAIITQAGHLNCTHIIHGVSIDVDDLTDEHIIRTCIANILQCAEENKILTLALPALGCGSGRFSVIGSAKIMTQEILKFCKRPSCRIKDITFCLYEEDVFKVFNKQVRGYIEHIQNVLGLEPYVTVDIIIEYDDGIVIIERSNPPYGWALPGGFVDAGESLEEAAAREAKEETNLDLINLKQMHTYSDPDRDPRFHTVSTVFTAKGKGKAKSGDDAKDLKVVKFEDLLGGDYAFDHKQVIKDYLKNK